MNAHENWHARSYVDYLALLIVLGSRWDSELTYRPVWLYAPLSSFAVKVDWSDEVLALGDGFNSNKEWK